MTLPYFNVDLLLRRHQEKKKNNVLYLKAYKRFFIILGLNSFSQAKVASW